MTDDVKNESAPPPGVSEALSTLKSMIETGFAQTRLEVTHVRQDVALMTNDLSIVKDRVTTLEKRVGQIEATPSDTDLQHAAALDKETRAREELSKKVDSLATSNELQLAILQRADKVLAVFDRAFTLASAIRKHPLVKALLAIATTAVLGYAASKNIALK